MVVLGAAACERFDDVESPGAPRGRDRDREFGLLLCGVVARRGLARLDEALEQESFIGVDLAQQARRGGFPADRGSAFC